MCFCRRREPQPGSAPLHDADTPRGQSPCQGAKGRGFGWDAEGAPAVELAVQTQLAPAGLSPPLCQAWGRDVCHPHPSSIAAPGTAGWQEQQILGQSPSRTQKSGTQRKPWGSPRAPRYGKSFADLP